MLRFLRKYQKFFFGLVAVVTIASFSFFGSYDTLQAPKEIPDRRLGALIDGSALMQRDVELLVRFLATSPHERGFLEKGQMPNLFNDGVIQKDFLQTGLLATIAAPYMQEIAPDLQVCLDKARAYRPYVHPQAPFVSAEAVWNQFFPSMKKNWDHLQRAKPDGDALRVLGELYLDQCKLPPDMLRRIMAYQEKQYEWIAHDERLDHVDLELFGFQTLEDWFGPSTMKLIAQVILNGAAEARRQGCRVSEDEARRSLQQNIYAAAKNTIAEHELTGQDVQRLFQQQIHMLHADERKVVGLWQRVMEFRKHLEDVGSKVAVDEATYRQFSDVAHGKLHLLSYELPASLQLTSFRDLLKLQTYLDAVAITPSKKPSASLRLPQIFASAEEVLMRTPELVETRFTAEIAEVSYDSLASRVTLKEIYAWEMQKEHWDELREEFPVLKQKLSSTLEERYSALEQLEPETRRRIDQAVREKIVREHPEWIENGFAQAERKTVTFGLRKKGGKLPFLGVNDREALLAALKKAPVKKSEDDRPTPYRLDTDEFHHYEVVLIQPASEWTMLTFAEASSDNTLDALLDKKLEEVYPDLRKKNPSLFQVSSGAWKRFDEVKDNVGAYYYADLLRLIASDAKEAGAEWPNSEDSRSPQPLNHYAEYRLRSYIAEALAALKKGETEEGWVASAHPRISEQWRLIKKEKELSRAELQELHQETLFDQNSSSWSSLFQKPASSWHFVKTGEKKPPEKTEVERKVKAVQEQLAIEAKRKFLQTLLSDTQSKKALVFYQRETL